MNPYAHQEPERTLTELDHARLAHLLRGSGVAADAAVSTMLDCVTVVPSRAVSPDIVTMYSQVLLLDLDTLQRQKLALCYPGDAQPNEGFVSVLSPVGLALLGLRVGGVAQWRTPSGDARRAEIVALLFQPEASGDYTT